MDNEDDDDISGALRLADTNGASDEIDPGGVMPHQDIKLYSPSHGGVFGPYGKAKAASADQGAGRGPQENIGASPQGSGRPFSLPVTEEGQVRVNHYSPQPHDVVDPAFNGSNQQMRGDEQSRRRYGNWVNRSYFGIGSPDDGGYKPEMSLGPYRHSAEIGAKDLYDMHNDPLNLRSFVGTGPNTNPSNDMEKAIKAAGFKGYYVNHPELGPVAAVFNRVEPQYVRDASVSDQGPSLQKLTPEGSGYTPVPGKPGVVDIPGQGRVEARPIKAIQDAASQYMASTGHPGEHELAGFGGLDAEKAAKIAHAYDTMQHDPQNPAVKRSYDAMIAETMDQLGALKHLGLKYKFNTPDKGDPYAPSPAMGYADLVKNGKLNVFPTEQGFGSNANFDAEKNPLLKRVGQIGDLPNATANDAFRIVHDIYGHFGPGNPFFRAPGEERAWEQHSKMYSPDALPAMTSETRGQNSWLNFGRYGKANQKASGENTIYADQKTGIMPPWTWEKSRGGAVDDNLDVIRQRYADGGDVQSMNPDTQEDFDPTPSENEDPAPYSQGVKLFHINPLGTFGGRAEPALEVLRLKAKEMEKPPKERLQSSGHETFDTSPDAYKRTTDIRPQEDFSGSYPQPIAGSKLPSSERLKPIIKSTDEIAQKYAGRMEPFVGKNVEHFYHTGPVHEGMEETLGSKQAADDFMKTFGATVAGTSPRTNTSQNVGNASLLAYKYANGLPFAQTVRPTGTANDIGYPMMEMHKGLTHDLLSGSDTFDSNPKPSSFAKNVSGNLQGVTADTHNIRGILAMFEELHPGKIPASWFNSTEAYKKYKYEGLTNDTLMSGIADGLKGQTEGGRYRQSEYGPIANITHKAAEHLGVPPATAQSLGWFALGDKTNLKSAPKTMTEILNEKIDITAQHLGISPESVTKLYGEHKIPLFARGGAVDDADDEIEDALALARRRYAEGGPTLEQDDATANEIDPNEPEQSPGMKLYKPSVAGMMGPIAKPQPTPIAPGSRFYSPVEHAVNQFPQDKFTNDQARAWLKATPQDEMNARDVHSFLDANPKLTKDQLQQHLANNKVEITPQYYGSAPPAPEPMPSINWVRDEYRKQVSHEDTVDAANDPTGEARANHRAIWDNLDKQNIADRDAWAAKYASHYKIKSTKYDDYALPGGENYRETTLSLPETPAPIGRYDTAQEINDKASEIEAVGFSKAAISAAANFVSEGGGLERGLRLQDAKISRGYGYTEGEKEAGTLLRSFLKGRGKQASEVRKQDFKSSHWDEPNVVAHIRSAEHWMPNEEKAYNLDELQSDWGQKGRANGFVNDDVAAQLAQLHAEHEDVHNQYKASIPADYSDTPESVALLDKKEALQQRIRDLQDKQGDIPNAPYVTSTKGWTDLGLKHALDQAIQSGAHAFTWTPGETQADRYDLSKKIKELRLEPARDMDGKPRGFYHLTAIDHQGNHVIDDKKVTTQEEIADHIGKDATEKFFTGDNKERLDNGRLAQISGLTLRMGGEGMTNFYNNMLPNRLSEIIRKATGQKPQIEDFKLRKYEDGQSSNVTHKGIRLTPQIKAAKFPMFSEGGFVNKPYYLKSANPQVQHALKISSDMDA